MSSLLTAIFYKESIKTRWCLTGLVLATLCFMLWLWLDIRHLFLMDHPEIVWYRVMDLGQMPYSSLTFFPSICGLIFCCFQFLPEMRDERMRLSLHLPCATATVMLAHLLYGLLCLLLLYLLSAAMLLFLLLQNFPYQLAYTALISATPWFLAGLYAYLCAAGFMLEPGKRCRLTFIVIGTAIGALMLSRYQPGSVLPLLPWFAAGLPLLLLGLIYPALHYRLRRVS